MSNRLHRRSFLSRVGLGITILLAAPAVAITRAFGNDNNEKDTKPVNKPAIRNTRALGFQWDTQDPFLFCVHHEDDFPAGNAEMAPDPELLKGRNIGEDFIIKDGWRMYHGNKVPGFPGHPHRGFETITVVRKGFVDHADSLGAAGRYGNGDVQWMTAGKGVQHSEMFPLIKSDEANPMELFQIWINLPKKDKMTEPHFKMLWSETIPRHRHADAAGKKTEIEVIAGKLEDKQAPAPPPDSWAAADANEVAVWNITMEPGARWTLPVASAGVNRTLYFYQGEKMLIAGTDITRYHAVDLEPDQAIELIAGEDECRLLMLQGKPIGEPVIQYGPFVMNTKQEIYEAFDDYHRTQFGGWPWPEQGQVHPRERGRFALHADKTEEIKDSGKG